MDIAYIEHLLHHIGSIPSMVTKFVDDTKAKRDSQPNPGTWMGYEQSQQTIASLDCKYNKKTAN